MRRRCAGVALARRLHYPRVMFPGRGPSRTAQLLEVGAFVLLILPSLVLGIVVSTPDGDMGFTAVAAAAIARDLSLVALIAYFMWRNGERPQTIGWVRRSVGKEIALGVLLFVPMTAAATALALALQHLGLAGPQEEPTFLQPEGAVDLVLAVALVLVVAITEETIFRGYLLLRLGNVTGSATLAVVGSSILFALGHGYEGARGMVVVGFMGVTFALVYLWRRSLVAPVVMHLCQDLMAIVVLPLLLRSS